MTRDGTADRAAMLAAALVAVATYALAVQLGFAYDDEPMLVTNRLIHSLSDLPAALARPYWMQYGTLYRPLTTLSFGIDWAIGGGAAWPFHLGNLLWHAVASALVVALALRWMPPLIAGIAGVAFAVHPVHIEAVCNGVGRAELLCGAALLGVAIVASRPGPQTRDQRLAVALLAFAAMGSKETGVTAPVLAAGAAWVATRDRRRVLAIAGSAVAGILPLLAARVIILGTVGGDQPHMAFQATSWTGGFLLALSTLPRSVGMLLVPQLPSYEHSPTMAQLDRPDAWLLVAGAALVIAGIGAIVALVRRPSWPAFALLVTAATLLPVSNLLFRAGIVLAERTLYAPSIGVVLLLASGLAFLPARPLLQRSAFAAVGLLMGSSAAISARDVRVWDRTSTVVDAFVTRNPASYAGWMFLGNVYVLRSQRDSAIAAYEHGLRLFDRDHRLVHATAVQELIGGDTARAEFWLRHALTRWPESRRSRTVLVHLLLAQRRGTEALPQLEAGLAFEPDQHGWVRLRDSLRRANPR